MRVMPFSPRVSRAALAFGVLLLASASLAQNFGDQRGVFDYPQVGGVALDWCVTWDRDCGQPAADNFCRAQGYGRSIGYLTYSPGRTNIAGQICEGGFCGGFSRIECGWPAQASAGANTAAANAAPPGMTKLCYFTQGPRAGETFDFTNTPGATFAEIGGYCWDGVASSGVGLDPATGSAAAGNPVNPPAAPAGTAIAANAGGGQNGVFPFPQANGVAVDGCATWATDCGQPSADQFCRTQGFASARSWNWAYDQRTWVIGSNMYCDTGPGVNCGGLRDVVCVGSGSITQSAAVSSGSASGALAGSFNSPDFGTVTITGGPTTYTGSFVNRDGGTGTLTVSLNPARGENAYSGSWEGGGYGGELQLTLQADGNLWGGWNERRTGNGAGNVWTRTR